MQATTPTVKLFYSVILMFSAGQRPANVFFFFDLYTCVMTEPCLINKEAKA